MRNIIDTEHVSIRETPPCKRIILTSFGNYYLDFPYIQYYLYKSTDKLILSATEDSFSTTGSNQFYQLPTFNVGTTGAVCQPKLTHPNTLEKMIDVFWSSRFTAELPPFRCNTEALSPTQYYLEWQKKGHPKIPAFNYRFTSDPNYYKSPETYFNPGRFCFDFGLNFYSIEKELRHNGVLFIKNPFADYCPFQVYIVNILKTIQIDKENLGPESISQRNIITEEKKIALERKK